MRTKLVYCMVSNDKDIYAEQTLFSVTSARAHNPSVHIVLMVDDETEKSLRGNGAADNSGWARKQLTESVDELKVVVLDSKYTNKQKSRLLKTSVRNVIEGDFVFIDSDTSIPGALSELDDLKHEMAAVRDCHWDLEEYPASFYNQLKEKLSLVGAHIEKIETYYNSGVIYAKDTPAVHEFYKRWQENYLNNLEKGMDFDQPTLALTNEQMGNFISHLPDKYNCQLNIAYVPNARIFHYIASGMDGVQRAESPFFAKDTYLKIKRGGYSRMNTCIMLSTRKRLSQSSVLINSAHSTACLPSRLCMTGTDGALEFWVQPHLILLRTEASDAAINLAMVCCADSTDALSSCSDASISSIKSSESTNKNDNEQEDNEQNTAPLLSVVMPVYNPGKYFAPCLDSVLGQTFRNFELIAIDDCSKDDSYKVLREYAAIDDRINPLKNEVNSGAAKTRNRGLHLARGKYIIFLDADDYFEREYFEDAIKALEKSGADVAICSIYIRDECAQTEAIWPNVPADFMKIMAHPFKASDFPDYIFTVTNAVPFDKVIRREYLLKEKLEFQDISNCNDLYFGFASLAFAEKIVFLPTPYVHYRYNTGGQISTIRYKKTICVCEAYKKIKEEFQTRGIYHIFSRSYHDILIGALSDVIVHSEDPLPVISYLHQEGMRELDLVGLRKCDFTNTLNFCKYQAFICDEMVVKRSNIRIFLKALAARNIYGAFWIAGHSIKAFLHNIWL